jgi:hypothetical protein
MFSDMGVRSVKFWDWIADAVYQQSSLAYQVNKLDFIFVLPMVNIVVTPNPYVYQAIW